MLCMLCCRNRKTTWRLRSGRARRSITLVEPRTPLKAGTFGEVDTLMEGALLMGGSCFGAAFWHPGKKVAKNGLKLSATHNIRDGKLYYERTAKGCSNTHLCFP